MRLGVLMCIWCLVDRSRVRGIVGGSDGCGDLGDIRVPGGKLEMSFLGDDLVVWTSGVCFGRFSFLIRSSCARSSLVSSIGWSSHGLTDVLGGLEEAGGESVP